MELNSLSLPLLGLIFIAAAACIWLAGIHLSKTTDILSNRFHLGEALGGAIVLAIVTNLPEIAITVSAALKGSLDLATGNILGGIAMQTVVLVLLDAFGSGKKGALSYLAASMPLIVEALCVVALLTLVVVGHQLPASLAWMRVSPATLLIAAGWIISLVLVDKAGKDMPWKAEGQQGQSGGQPGKKKQDAHTATGKALAIFLLCALITLIAGVGLEVSGDAMAHKIHLDGVIFGATVLALATSLPEISTGLAAVKLGDYELAVSDILGGNAFLPVLFLLAAVVSGKQPLPAAQRSDIYLTAIAILLTLIYAGGFIFKSKKQYARMGIDSLWVLLVYLLGVGGLFFIARS